MYIYNVHLYAKYHIQLPHWSWHILIPSAPGIAERLAFKSLDDDVSFSLFNNKHKDLVKLFLDNNVGGPALIFDRWQQQGNCRLGPTFCNL